MTFVIFKSPSPSPSSQKFKYASTSPHGTSSSASLSPLPYTGGHEMISRLLIINHSHFTNL